MSALTERHVQAIWYDERLRPEMLFTRRGTEVHVVHPGNWNLSSGPDFTNAVLEIGRERRRLVGDVEVHLSPSDWESHGHGEDIRYRNVIAHVTWRQGPVPLSLPPDAVSIWLGRFVLSDPCFSPDAIDLRAYPYSDDGSPRPCRARFDDPAAARQALVSAGQARLAEKSRRAPMRLGTEQSFYEEVMNALGYRRNSVPFRRVARRVPYAVLPTDSVAAAGALVAAGGFETFDRIGSRPSNSPERRLAAAGELFVRTPLMRLRMARDFSEAATRGMVRALSNDHIVGPGRAAAILANIVVPFALASGEVAAIPEWLPPEDLSEPVRLTAHRLFGRDHNPVALYAGNGVAIQGLLGIWRGYCMAHHPDCVDCGLVRDFERDGPGAKPSGRVLCSHAGPTLRRR